MKFVRSFHICFTCISILLSLLFHVWLMILRLVGHFKLMALRNVESIICLILKWVSKNSIVSLLQAIQKSIIIYNKHWHDRVTYQNSLGIFSFSLVPDKKLSFSSNIYLLSLLLDQLSSGSSVSIQSEIKDLLKMANIGTDHKGYIYVYASDNICSQINKLVSNRDRVRNTKMQHAKMFWLDPYKETWKTSLSTFCP